MRTIKLIFVNIILLLTIFIHAQSIDKVKTVNLNCNEEPLNSVLEKIRTKTGIDIIYRNDLVDNLKITCALHDCSIENALEKILKRHNISYNIFNKESFVLVKTKKPIRKQFKTLVVQQNPPNDEFSLEISEPQMITKRDPIYPQDAVKSKIEGDITVKFLVTTDGSVKNTLVEQSSGSPILDSATVVYTRTLKYIPAYFKDKPKNVWISMKFKYYITN